MPEGIRVGLGGNMPGTATSDGDGHSRPARGLGVILPPKICRPVQPQSFSPGAEPPALGIGLWPHTVGAQRPPPCVRRRNP